MKKKIISIVTIVLVIAVMAGCMSALAGCSKVFKKGLDEKVELSEIKIGLITLHDENSTYDKNFIDAMKKVQANLGLKADQVLFASGIPEGDECYQKACELADQGCNIIIADSFGHGDYMIKAAKKYPTVLFAHATGTKAHTETDLDNFVNAFASIYEGRYLAGIVAGLKLEAMGYAADSAPVVGYIGAYTYAEVMSGYTSWFLGVREIIPSATMKVTFTGSWYDETKEKNAAENLIKNEHCVLISQHADSMGAPNACEKAGIPNVSYNGSTAAACPNTFLVSSRINWAPYYEYLIKCRQEGIKPTKDYVGTYGNGVELTELGSACDSNIKARLAVYEAEIIAGTRKVFDTNKFTVTDYDKDGKVVKASYKLTSYKADVDDTVGADGKSDYIHETEVIKDGYFHESEYRSAPYFDVEIDGITLLDRNYGD